VSGQSNYVHEQALAFGPYRLYRSRKLLLNADRQVRIGSRAFDILAALVERAGEVVSSPGLPSRATLRPGRDARAYSYSGTRSAPRAR